MYAIASLLDPTSSETVSHLWERFKEKCGLAGIVEKPLPHFSYMGADSFLFEPVEEALAQIAHETQPFTVLTTGIGLFTGEKPVVYIPVIKSERLMALHEKIWQAVRAYSIVPNLYYDPEKWLPHITLAYRDTDLGRLGCGVEDIAYENIDMPVIVDHLAFIYQTEGMGGIRRQFPFGGGEQ